MLTPIKRVIEIAGSQSSLADKLRVKPQAVQQWVSAGRFPAPRVIEIAKAVNWMVTPHELDPAIYPHPSDGLPDQLRGSVMHREAA